MTTKKNEKEAAKPAHTPGPLEVRTRPHGVHTRHEVTTAGGRVVALALPYFADDGTLLDDGSANARLIASAPDLLAALLAVYKDLDIPNVKGGSDELNQLVFAAIAKAEGK